MKQFCKNEVKIRSCRIENLLFADNAAILTGIKFDLYHALNRFAAGCDKSKHKKKTDVYTSFLDKNLIKLICTHAKNFGVR